MPLVNDLKLEEDIINIDYQDFPEILLPQIRRLSLPDVAEYNYEYKNDVIFHLSRIFPCVEKLNASVISKHQTPFIIDQFEQVNQAYFFDIWHEPERYESPDIRVTEKWLKTHSNRLKRLHKDDRKRPWQHRQRIRR